MATVKKTAIKRAAQKKAAPKKKATASTGTGYLTKRILTKAARTGFTNAAANTMQVMGYNVIVHSGWVVKKYADGRIEKIKKLDKTNSRTAIALD